jgi:hypothetical protein
LTALVNTLSVATETPAVYVIEDAHWIDEVSESMLADFLTVTAQTPSLTLVTYRPEYRGALAQVPGAQTVSLAPLSASETTALVAELLGPDPSVGELCGAIAERAAGTPFFAEEIVRELAERGVLQGKLGAYVSTGEAAEVSVPATLQATIASRIDRLDPAAKRTLSAAAVVGSRFSLDLLTVLGAEPVVADLVAAQLIDQVTFTRQPEYVFHHPLIRAVAYEAQLKSDRAELHRRIAAAIEAREPQSADQNAALIAEHLQAAGDLRAAYDWRMRAGSWSTNRDIAAARLGWERARQLADRLPDDDPDRTALRIAPRTMLCVSAWRAVEANSSSRFEELRELCTAAGDKTSLAIAMTGLITELVFRGRVGEASRLASEQMTLLESIGDPTLTIGAAYVPMVIKLNTGAFADGLRWSQAVIDLADGDPAKGASFAMGSPLAAAVSARGMARYWLGRAGWREDLDDAVAMVRSSDSVTHALLAAGIYGMAIACGVLRADDGAVCEVEAALQSAAKSSGDTALGSAKLFLGFALLHRDPRPDRDRGLELLTQVRDTWLREQTRLYLIPSADVYLARETARRGDRDGAIPVMRQAANDLFQQGQLVPYVLALGILVETLLNRGAEGDLAEAEAAIDRLANLPATEGWLVRDILLLRLNALLARARGENTAYRNYRDRYRDTARTLGFEGHIAIAEAMP